MATRARAIACAAAALLVLSSAARADYEETERRLKTAGIGDALRGRIHKAIDRGVGWLALRQGPDGSFSLPGQNLSDGYTALCCLALRHSGTPAALASHRKAREYLRAHAKLEERVYECGIAAMTLMADGGPAAEAQRYADALVRGQAASGSWGYETRGPGAGAPVNLSTAQFGALGLWAAARAGAEVPAEAWVKLARGHCADQQPDGFWRYSDESTPGMPGKIALLTYPQGNFMGAANVILAEAALKDHLAEDEDLARRVAAARQQALAALERTVPAYLERFETKERGERGLLPGLFRHYGLYAMEKVCIFAGKETYGGVRWYERGARALVDQQRKDGSWDPAAREGGEKALDATAFALLFLLRASSAYTPVSPRPVDAKPPTPLTPSEPAK